jgi:hypothetical protein
MSLRAIGRRVALSSEETSRKRETPGWEANRVQGADRHPPGAGGARVPPLDYFVALTVLTAMKLITAREYLAAALDLRQAGFASAWDGSARQRVAQLG